jgi:hypothetical protein
MDERHGTIRLADQGESEARGLVTTVPRAAVEQALQSDEPVDLLLDIERAVEGEGRETQRLALGWERQDLERLLENDGSDITLTFDEAELQRLLDEDVEAHGMREKLAVLTVVAAGIAGAGAGSALASPSSGDGSLAGGTPVPAATAQAPSSEISTGLVQQNAAHYGGVAAASEISTGLGGQQTAAQAGREATASEISTGLGGQTAATEQPGRTGPSEISTGITGETAATPSEISTGIVGETPAPASEVSTGIVQEPAGTPVSADQPSWSPSPSEGAAIAVGAILALTAVGFAARSRRGPTLAT